MSSNANNSTTKPIAIDTANAHSAHGRSRSASLLSTSSSFSSMPGLSPTSSRGSPPRANASAILTPALSLSRNANSPTTPAATSPLAAYFLSGTSPSKGNNPFFPNTFAPTVVDEDAPDSDLPKHGIPHRRMSTSWVQGGNRFGTTSGGPLGSAENHERGAGVLRRLSLGAAFATRPSAATLPSRRPPSPPAMEEPTRRNSPPRAGARAKRRTATISEAPKKRSVSPMGERMLKGHFDGFGL